MNSEKFTLAFNQIEEHLRKLSKVDKYTSFYQLVQTVADSNVTIHKVVRQYQDDLRQFADLRNAIVHTRKKNFVIAEPHDSIVESIEELYRKLTNPKKVDSFIQTVYTITLESSLSDVLETMIPNDYSQAPVVQNNENIAMLNSEAITRWLGKRISDDLISLGDTRIEEILGCSDTRNNFQIISRNETLIGVRDIFVASIENPTPLEALIITQNGKKTETPIGIITRSEDLATVIKDINL